MLLSEILAIYDLIDRPGKPGREVARLLEEAGARNIVLEEVRGERGSTEFIKVSIPGKQGKAGGGKAPTLGVIGRLGGLGARPELIGLVSDGDGAWTALSVALKLAKMAKLGDILEGDVIVATHICTNAPTRPHDPVPFMGSPVDTPTMNSYEIDQDMDAILSIDTSRGNKVINQWGFAISPTIKEGYILKVSADLLSIMEQTTGKLPVVFAVTTPDITPYGNGLDHINSILQPCTVTNSPVVAVAITSEVPVAGSATGVSNPIQIDSVGRYVIEVAQRFGKGTCKFYSEEEFNILVSLYGKMNHLQTIPKRG